MKFFLRFIILLLANNSFAQYTFPPLKETTTSLMDFIPKNWFVSDSAFGDLNKDGLIDIAFIITKKDSVIIVNEEEDSCIVLPKALVIATRNNEGFYTLRGNNTSILLNIGFPITFDSPFREINIINHSLVVNFFYDCINGNFYSYEYKFALRDELAILIGADVKFIERNNMNYEKASYNFLSMKWSLSLGNEANGKENNIEWFKINSKSPKLFESIKAPHDWTISNGISFQ